MKVIRYGLTRQWVLGLQVVLADGRVLELNGALEKNNTGIDLRQLFIGSEAVLGIVTEATLKLATQPTKHDVFLFAVPDIAGVLKLFPEARLSGLLLSAFEFFTDKCLARVEKHRKLRSPFEAPSGCYVLLELEGAPEGPRDAWLSSLFEKGVVTDGTLAQGVAQAKELWGLREGISESLSATGLPHKKRHRVADRRARAVLRVVRCAARRALSGFRALPVRPHRRREPARQRDEAGRAGQARQRRTDPARARPLQFPGPCRTPS